MSGLGTYFVHMVVAYAIGLGMANIAVYVFHMGQPALLYLVPCCLGTMCILGWQRQELRQLWDGPKVLETAEQIVNGSRETSSVVELSPKQTSEGEVVDDEVGDVPLLNQAGD